MAAEVRADAEGLKDQAESLNYEAEDLTDRAAQARRRLEQYENQADHDSTRVDEVLLQRILCCCCGWIWLFMNCMGRVYLYKDIGIEFLLLLKFAECFK